MPPQQRPKLNLGQQARKMHPQREHAAATAVFTTFELTEHILGYLQPADILINFSRSKVTHHNSHLLFLDFSKHIMSLLIHRVDTRDIMAMVSNPASPNGIGVKVIDGKINTISFEYINEVQWTAHFHYVNDDGVKVKLMQPIDNQLLDDMIMYLTQFHLSPMVHQEIVLERWKREARMKSIRGPMGRQEGVYFEKRDRDWLW